MENVAMIIEAHPRAAFVAAGILAYRGAGLPSPAEEASQRSKRVEMFARHQGNSTLCRAARMPPSTAGRDACRHVAVRLQPGGNNLRPSKNCHFAFFPPLFPNAIVNL
jgi:hypothetical protein